MAQRPDDGHRMVWYCSYGSNLCAERFYCYVVGGKPPGASRTQPGARDTTLPLDDRPLEIPYRLYFAGVSKFWDGSPCFIDTLESSDTPTLARAYLITWGQFEDVVAQENGRSTSPIDLELKDLSAGSSRLIGPGRYENMLCTGHIDGVPALTFTSPCTMAEANVGAPAVAYLRLMVTGLRESHGLSDGALVTYLGSAPGCSEQLVSSVLVA
jgi:hypothetical protein